MSKLPSREEVLRRFADSCSTYQQVKRLPNPYQYKVPWTVGYLETGALFSARPDGGLDVVLPFVVETVPGREANYGRYRYMVYPFRLDEEVVYFVPFKGFLTREEQEGPIF